MMHATSFYTDASMTEIQRHPRSPSRAKRRAKMGHPQHHRLVPSSRFYQVGDSLFVCHPAMVDAIKVRLAGPGAAR